MDPNVSKLPVAQQSPKNKLLQWLTTVTLFSKLLAMVLFITFPLVGFYIGLKYQERISVAAPVTSEVKITVSPTPRVSMFDDSSTGSVEYISTELAGNSNRAYSLVYPNSWNREVKRTKEIIDELNLSNGDYLIKIIQTSTGGAGCIFEGEVPNGPFSDYTDKEYVEFQSGVGTLRRVDDTQPGSSNISFDFCYESSEGNYSMGAGIGSVTYEVPKNYDTAILLEMDGIIKTLKKVN